MGERLTDLRVSSLLEEITSLDSELAAEISSQGGTKADYADLTAKCLELLSRKCCHLANTRQYNSPILQRFVHPNFVWATERGISARSQQEFINRMNEAAKANPAFEIKPVNSCVKLAKCGTKAIAWMTLRIHGLPNSTDWGQTRDVMGRFKWVREGGKWYWASNHAMMGMGNMGWEFD